MRRDIPLKDAGPRRGGDARAPRGRAREGKPPPAGPAPARVELRSISADDLALYEGIYCDARMMEHLGGAFTRERARTILDNSLGYVESGRGWVFKVVAGGDAARAAGIVCIWKSYWKGKRINEIGWMILPRFQGRGLASEAVRAVLSRARAERRWYVIHALTGADNGPSTSICLKTGFTRVEECEFEYSGRALRGHLWRLDLRGAGALAGRRTNAMRRIECEAHHA